MAEEEKPTEVEPPIDEEAADAAPAGEDVEEAVEEAEEATEEAEEAVEPAEEDAEEAESAYWVDMIYTRYTSGSMLVPGDTPEEARRNAQLIAAGGAAGKRSELWTGPDPTGDENILTFYQVKGERVEDPRNADTGESASYAQVSRWLDDAKAQGVKASDDEDDKGGKTPVGVIAVVAVVVIVLVLAIAAMATGVLGSGSGTDEDVAVAATVGDDIVVTEDEVTEYIESVREYYGYTDDDDWADYLDTLGYTAESLREEIIEYYIEDKLVDAAIEEYGVTVEDGAAEDYLEEEAATYGYSTDEYVELIETYYGYTEDEYLEMIETYLLEDALVDEVAPATDVADDDVVAYVNDAADSYDGAKRSSHILISVDDVDDEDELAEALATAEEAYEAVASGEMTFEEAAAEYSDDSSSTDGGDVGWDCESSFVDEYQEALDALAEGEMSEPVLSDYGYHVILCTDVYEIDEDGETSVDNIPEDIYDTIVSELQLEQVEEDYEVWLEDYKASFEIVIYDMPEGLSYDPDSVTDDEDSDDEETDEEESDDEETDEEDEE